MTQRHAQHGGTQDITTTRFHGIHTYPTWGTAEKRPDFRWEIRKNPEQTMCAVGLF